MCSYLISLFTVLAGEAVIALITLTVALIHVRVSVSTMQGL